MSASSWENVRNHLDAATHRRNSCDAFEAHAHAEGMSLPGTHPVEIDTFDRTGREVRIEIPDAEPQWGLCKSETQFKGMIDLYRPEIDLTDPRQVYWADRPNEWP